MVFCLHPRFDRAADVCAGHRLSFSVAPTSLFACIISGAPSSGTSEPVLNARDVIVRIRGDKAMPSESINKCRTHVDKLNSKRKGGGGKKKGKTRTLKYISLLCHCLASWDMIMLYCRR